MPDVMLDLGGYRFSIDTAAYQTLRRTSEFRWATMMRIAHRPSLQWIGLGMEDIDLHGTIYPHYKGGLGQLDSMRDKASKGESLYLVTGRGENLGLWCILSVEEHQATFTFKGTPLKIDFNLRIKNFGPEYDSGTKAFVGPLLTNPTVLGQNGAQADLLEPPPLIAADLAPPPFVTLPQVAPYADGMKQAGLTEQQAATKMTQAVQQLRQIDKNATITTQALTTLNITYSDLQSGLTHDPVGTLGRLLTGNGGATPAVLTKLFGAGQVGSMMQLGTGFKLASSIQRTVGRF